MTDLITNMVPLWVDLGYRASPEVYYGLYFQYGFGSLNTDAGRPESPCTAPGLRCSTSDVRVGVDTHLYFSPHATFDPWLGAGVGVEVHDFSASAAGASTSVTTIGFEYLNLELGVDWNINASLALGPFVSFSFDQYESISASGNNGGEIGDKTFHEWLVLGVRTLYDFSRNSK